MSLRNHWIYGNAATLITHTAAIHDLPPGELLTVPHIWTVQVQQFSVGRPITSDIQVFFVRPRRRKEERLTIRPSNFEYLTIERDGEVLYDSRSEIPCDMAEFAAAAQRCAAKWRLQRGEQAVVLNI